MTEPKNYTTTFPAHNEPRPNLLANDNLRTWLELEAVSTGSENQIERYHAGVLPEDELTTLARLVLFAPFAAVSELRRWAGRDRDALARDLRHRMPRTVTACDDVANVEIETAEVGELTASEWTMLKNIQRLAGVVSTHPWMTRGRAVPAYNHTREDSRLTPCPLCKPAVEVVASTHWATCAVCEAEACRSSAKVSISWAGRTLVREWAL